MRIVATSDTHIPVAKGFIPDGDVFFHSGDLCKTGYPDDFESMLDWLNELPHPLKYFTPGNHDFHLQVYPGPALQQLRSVGVTVLGLPGNDNFMSAKLPNGMSVVAFPYVHNLPRWAFNISVNGLYEVIRNQERHDIVLSHSPIYGILDEPKPGIHTGSRPLKDYLHYHRPSYWFNGHIHEGYGHEEVEFNDGRKCQVYNVAACDRTYTHTNQPVVLDL